MQESIPIKELLNNFIEANNSTVDFVQNLPIRQHENIDALIVKTADRLTQTPLNATIGLLFMNLLQLVENENIVEQYHLADISRAFDSFVELQNLSLDAHIEAAHFEWAVMNNEEKAKKIIKAGIDQAKEKIEELNKLLTSIENDIKFNT